MPAEGMKFNYQADYEALDSGLAGDVAQGIAGLINEPGFADRVKAAGKINSATIELAKTAGFAVLGMVPGF